MKQTIAALFLSFPLSLASMDMAPDIKEHTRIAVVRNEATGDEGFPIHTLGCHLWLVLRTRRQAAGKIAPWPRVCRLLVPPRNNGILEQTLSDDGYSKLHLAATVDKQDRVALRVTLEHEQHRDELDVIHMQRGGGASLSAPLFPYEVEFDVLNERPRVAAVYNADIDDDHCSLYVAETEDDDDIASYKTTSCSDETPAKRIRMLKQ